MSKPLFTRPRAFATGLAYFLPGWVVFASAAFLPQPWTVASLLLGNALILCAVAQVCAATTQSFAERTLRGGTTFLVLQTFYVALLAQALAYPLAAVLRDHALPSALLMSTVVFVALLALWRLWPAFGLPMTDELAGRSAPFASAAAALSLGARLTSRHELYFASGLIVSVSMLLIGAGALALAGFGLQFPADLQWPALIGYAVIISPLAMVLIVRCTQTALRHDQAWHATARSGSEAASATAAPAITQEFEAPHDIVDHGRDRRGTDAALLSAARSGDLDAAIVALEQGADPNLVPEGGARDQRSVLVLACLSPNLALLRALIAKGVDVNHVHAGLPALIAATRDSHQGRPDAVMTLLTNGADPRCADAEGNTPLHYAARAAQPVVAALLCDAGAPIDATNHEGQTPLAIASAAGKCDSVRFLLERRANPQVERAQPALVAAAGMSDEDPDLVKLLLKHKAAVDARDTMGRTALISAALHDNPDIAAVLLKAGADINAADDRGTTALMEAARAGATDVVDVLAAHAPAIDGIDRLGRTALMLASQSAQADEGIVRRLLALGASTQVSTPEGRRAVDLAAAAGRWSVVQLLDPEYPLPASVDNRGDAQLQRGVTSAHLLDALRFAHWPIVDAFAPQVRAWNGEQVAQLFADLATHADPQPRAWLLAHGLDPNASLADGTGLLATMLARLPETLPAVEQLLAAGAQAAGVGLLQVVLDALRGATDAQRTRLEALGLELLARGADPFGADALARTALACSIAHGQVRAAEWLLARGIDANLRDRHGRSALFAALVQPSPVAEALVRALVRAGADPERADANGETPLGIALAQPQSEIRRWLNWTAWKLPKRPLRDGDLPAAAKLGDAAAVEKLLDLGLAIDATDSQGATALVHAAGAGHVDIVVSLLDRGAQSERAAAAGATALSAAVSARRAAVVAAMLERKIDPDQRLAGGGTALMIAAALGYPEIVAQLLAHGADPNAQDERATRALHAAAQFAFASRDTPRARKVLELLMEKGADLNAIDGKGRTPLLFLLGARAEPGSAGDQQHLQALLSLFLVGRADVNLQDERGVSALHACAMHGLLIPARALLVARADPEARDMRGRTPREVANLLGYLDVSAELIMRPLAATPLPGQPAELR